MMLLWGLGFSHLASNVSKLEDDNKMLQDEMVKMQSDIRIKDSQIEKYKVMLATKDNQIANMQAEMLYIKSRIDESVMNHISRGGYARKQNMRITAYDLSDRKSVV